MPQAPRLPSKRLHAYVVLCVLTLAAAAMPSSAVAAPLPGAGVSQFNVTGQVGVASRLGAETFAISGTATVSHAAPHMEGSVQVANMEVTALDLSGASLVGQITISESPSRASTGELRGLAPPPNSFPASNTLSVYIEAIAPANPQPTMTLYNTAPLTLVPKVGGVTVPLDGWPPHDVTYVANTTPCVHLFPTLPLDACVTSLSVTLRIPFVGGVSELAAASPRERAVRDDDAAITPLEGVLAGVAAVAGAAVIAGAGWYLRRLRAER